MDTQARVHVSIMGPAGKDKLLGFFVGQVMQKTRGKANPGQVNEAIKRRLDQP